MEHRRRQNHFIKGKADSEDYHESMGLGSVLVILDRGSTYYSPLLVFFDPS